MSIAAIKEQVISKFVKKVSSLEDEEALKMILAFLDGIKKDDPATLDLAHHYDAIKQKYGDVLKRLSQ
jgi:hypothetical protein